MTPVAVTRCCCGGTLAAYGIDQQSLAKAMRLHQSTARHREWRLLGGFDFHPETLGRRLA